MKRIMFVCHGNICRSPMAEMLFKKMIADVRLQGQIEAFSSAVSSEEIYRGVGNPIYPPARAELKRRGVPVLEHRAVQLKREDYEKYDLFLCMDESNLRGMHRIFGGDPEGKCKKLLDLTPQGGEVADPWYTGGFGEAFEDIEKGCRALLEVLRADGKAE